MNLFDPEKTKKACDISVSIIKELTKHLKSRSFSTEIDIHDFLVKKAKEKRCSLAFRPIVAAGKNAAEIHHKAEDAGINGFLVIDFGVRYKGYCSDMTRTFYIGKPKKEEISLYDKVLLAQETAIMHSLPGAYAADIDLIARAVLQEYFKNFSHALGHGVGKNIHQSPSVSPKSKRKLKKGQTITIEPGLYFKNRFGIRIEDTILIKDRPIILTRLTKKLVIIDEKRTI